MERPFATAESIAAHDAEVARHNAEFAAGTRKPARRRQPKARPECTECGAPGPAGMACTECYEGHFA